MQPVRGALLMMSAVSLFVVMTSLIKAVAHVPAGEAVFFRSFFAMPVIVVWLLAQGEFPTGLRTSNWKGHAIRGTVGTLAMGLSFAGVRYLPLPEVTALRFVTPILILIFAALLLGERLRLIRISAVSVGLVGVLIIMWPRLRFDTADGAVWGVALTLGSATFAALAQIFVKGMSKVERTAAIVFYFTLTATTASLFTISFGWVWPQGWDWVALIGAGLIGGVGQILLTSSYRFADAGVVAPFTYISMLWALVIGYFAFGEVPTVPMLGGAALVIAAGVAIVLRERQLGLQRTAERKVRAKQL